MVAPSWFYSTIAQASAAIIGLTIAFTISTHLSRRERRRKGTDEAREEASDLKQKYQPLMDTIARTIRTSAGFTVDNPRYELENVSSVESWANDKETPISARVWALTSGISYILSDFSLLNPETARDQIELLHKAVQELEYSIFHCDNGNDRLLYSEIMNQDSEEADGHYYFDDILDEPDGITAWLDRNRRTRDENIAGARATDLTGENIFSLGVIAEILDADLDDFVISAVESDLTADFLSTDFGSHVLRTSMKLATFGIFLPILFLITSPDLALPRWGVRAIPPFIFNFIDSSHLLLNLVAQFTILFATAYYTLRLFMIMWIDMRTTVPTMGGLLGIDDEDDSNEADSDTSSTGLEGPLQGVIGWIQLWSLPPSIRENLRDG